MNDAGTREGDEGGTSVETRPSITACLRCREQKLKCGRERPACSRCDRLNARFSYPVPPNRRGPRPRIQRDARSLNRTTKSGRECTRPQRAVVQSPYDEPVPQLTSTIAARRPNPTSSHLRTSPSGPNDVLEGNTSPRSDTEADDASALLDAGTPVLSDSYPTQLRTMSATATEPAHISDQPPLPPTALGLSLLEIYFTRVYNAPLLFYKPVLFQQYLEGELHGALLRTLLALATLFLQPTVSEYEYQAAAGHAELKSLSMYHSSGLPWATAALKEVMALAMDSPSLMIIQALEYLQLYWFGIGQPHRGNLCLALACRACHLLGYSRKFPNEIDDSDVSLESELRRRCFWACWTSTCIVMDPEPYIKASWQEVAGVPLPGLISNTSSGCRITLSERMDEEWHPSALFSRPRTETLPGATALLMKMMGVWAKVQLWCKDYAFSPVTQNFDSGERLPHLATLLFDDAASLRDFGYDSYRIPENEVLWLVHDSIYHQCQISIHSMVVPIFSGISTDPKIGRGRQRKSAETVAKHADLFQCLLEPFFYGQRHVSFLPPLVGHGAFVAGVVLLTMEISSNKEMNEFPVEASRNGCRLTTVKSILHLLDNLRVYWRALQGPWETLHAALQTDFSKYIQQYRPADHTNVLSAHPSACEPSKKSTRYNQNMGVSNEQQQPSMANNGAEEVQSQDHAHLANVNSEFQEPSEIETSNQLTSPIDLPHDYDWYTLSFAEAGVEQFAGLEPFTLLQEGWQSFG